MDKISESCPFEYTGADFYALVSDAAMNAIARSIKMIDAKVGNLFLLIQRNAK